MAGLERLNAVGVKSKKTPGYYCDGGGLYLQVAKGGSKSWIFRYTLNGKTREMGLGSLNAVTLAQARDKARELRFVRTQGLDPIEARADHTRKQNLVRLNSKTFKQCADDYINTHRSEWNNPKHAQQWENTIETYANPTLGSMFVQEITSAHVKRVLDPIWTTKKETASRLRGRIEEILDAAKASGYRKGENPAAWKGNLSHLLAKRSAREVRHFPALPWPMMHEFLVELRKREGVAPRALEFTVLTVARSGEVRGALWSEFDLDAKLWGVPAERMKMKVEHTHPLTDDTIKLLRALPRFKGCDLVFPNERTKKPLSDMALTKLLRDMNTAAGGKRWVDKAGECATAHGFRSSFKDWATECTDHSETVVEIALAHKVGSEVERAYRRGELLMKRRVLMNDWAKYCNTPRPEGNVIPMVQKKDVA